MASRIQGITVEIGGDTTKLSKALEAGHDSSKCRVAGRKMKGHEILIKFAGTQFSQFGCPVTGTVDPQLEEINDIV